MSASTDEHIDPEIAELTAKVAQLEFNHQELKKREAKLKCEAERKKEKAKREAEELEKVEKEVKELKLQNKQLKEAAEISQLFDKICDDICKVLTEEDVSARESPAKKKE
jgi:uncharacterized protein YhaN